MFRSIKAPETALLLSVTFPKEHTHTHTHLLPLRYIANFHFLKDMNPSQMIPKNTQTLLTGLTLQVSAKPKVLALWKRAHGKGLTPRVLTKRASLRKVPRTPKGAHLSKGAAQHPETGNPKAF